MHKLMDLVRSAYIRKFNLKEDLRELRENEDGAALIEYTVLLGVLLVAVIATIGLVGTWVLGQWQALQGALPGAGGGGGGGGGGG
jgi:pilus assembly protein Flp/PilA